MTGKENLLLDEISFEAKHIQNHIYGCDGSVDESVECIVANCNSLEKIFNELKEENTKYKRAFEILKEIFDIRFEKDEDGDCWIKIFPKTYDDRHILGEPTNEQYELLEELMKDE